MNDTANDETADVTITDVAYRGKGVARLDGRVVFVPGVAVGEVVRIRVERTHKRHADARLVEVLETSPERISPPCPLAATCPGCAYQHLAYSEELRVKQAQLAGLLQRMAGVPESVCAEPFPSPADLGYRNKIVLHAAGEHPGRHLGYVGEDNVTVIDVPSCPLAVDSINERLKALRADDAFMASLEPETRVTLRHTAKDGTSNWVGRAERRPWLTETTSAGAIKVSRGSFFQVNPPVADALSQHVGELLGAGKTDMVIDLYCGCGVLALAAKAAGAAEVLGIDSDSEAVKAARVNARERKLDDVHFLVDRDDRGLAHALGAAKPGRVTLVMDPPRRGLSAATLRVATRKQPAHMVYVSCAADTMARDLKQLQAAGYAVRSCRLFDMFPRTAAFETVALLSRR